MCAADSDGDHVSRLGLLMSSAFAIMSVLLIRLLLKCCSYVCCLYTKPSVLPNVLSAPAQSNPETTSTWMNLSSNQPTEPSVMQSQTRESATLAPTSLRPKYNNIGPSAKPSDREVCAKKHAIDEARLQTCGRLAVIQPNTSEVFRENRPPNLDVNLKTISAAQV